MPKIVQFNLPPGGTVVQVANGLEDALDIESTESEDFLQISTKTGDEDVRMVKSAHYAYGDNLNNTPRMTITPQDSQVLFDTGAGSGRDFSFRPEGTERFRVTEGHTKITGKGGTTGYDPGAGQTYEPTLFLENSTGSSADRCSLVMNGDSNHVNIDMAYQDNLKLRIMAQDAEQSITAEDSLVLKAEATDAAMFTVTAASTFSTGAVGTALTGKMGTGGASSTTVTGGTGGDATNFATQLHVGSAIKLTDSGSGAISVRTVTAIDSASTPQTLTIDTAATVAAGSSGHTDGGELFAVKTGNSKTLLGLNGTGALQLNSSTGDITKGNLAIGDATTLDACTDGKLNTIVGNAPNVYALTGGHSNSFFGYQAGENLSSGVRNTFLGLGAGYGTAGSVADNTYVGVNAGAQVTGSSNVAVGSGALIASGGAVSSVAIGKDALAAATGAYNIAVGTEAGDGVGSGGGNLLLGYQADCDASANYQIAIGFQVSTAAVSTAAIGDATRTATLNFGLAGQSWSTTSDERIKENVQNSKLGLDFINALRPITYTEINPQDWPEDIRPHVYFDREKTRTNEDGTKETYIEPAKEREATSTVVVDGLMAQEVKAAADAAGASFSGWEQQPNGLQRLQYEKFVLPLIAACQDLSAQVMALTARVAELEAGD